MPTSSNIACAILAGGKNSRMGGVNKAFLEVENTPILEKISKVLEEVFDEILIVTNSPEEYAFAKGKHAIVTDVFKNIGPLGGIHAALLNTTKEALFFVPCDMPFISKGLIEEEIAIFEGSGCDAIIPKIGEFIEPLHALYRKDLYIRLHSFLNNTDNYAIRAFLDVINVYYLELEANQHHEKIFFNINKPKDFNQINRFNYCLDFVESF